MVNLSIKKDSLIEVNELLLKRILQGLLCVKMGGFSMLGGGVIFSLKELIPGEVLRGGTYQSPHGVQNDAVFFEGLPIALNSPALPENDRRSIFP